MGMAVVPMIGPAIGGVLDETLGWQANFWMLAILGALVLALVWRDLGETAARGSASFAEQFGEYPELFASRRFWGYCLAAGLRLGRLLRLSRRRALTWVPRSSASRPEVGLYFGAPALGYFFGNWLSGATRCGWGINGMILWGTILYAAGLILSLLLFLMGLKTALVLLRLHDLRGPRQRHGAAQRHLGHAVGAPASGGHGQWPGRARSCWAAARRCRRLAGALLTGGNGRLPADC
jgi:DHA1 family bicyclomycin/chloramphenicol resistance-like MFS transporter